MFKNIPIIVPIVVWLAVFVQIYIAIDTAIVLRKMKKVSKKFWDGVENNRHSSIPTDSSVPSRTSDKGKK